MSDPVKAFNEYREKQNARLLDNGNLTLKRLFHLDASAYKDGALDIKTKEMLGLMGSLVLRCDDCIRYHVEKCHDNGITKEELDEVLAIALVVGGTIVIPHTRRAVEFYDAVLENRRGI